MAKITERHIKAWEKFNEELNAYRADYGDEYAYLYEDAYTTRQVKDFKMSKTGVLTWKESEMTYTRHGVEYVERSNREQMWDEEDAKDWLKFWRSCLRRAKKYNSMPTEVLDAIQEGEREDIKDED